MAEDLNATFYRGPFVPNCVSNVYLCNLLFGWNCITYHVFDKFRYCIFFFMNNARNYIFISLLSHYYADVIMLSVIFFFLTKADPKIDGHSHINSIR
jgi:hypothetical protein